MYSNNLKNWQIFNILKSKFIQNIRVAAVYGSSGEKAIIATFNNMVYTLEINGSRGTKLSVNPVEISELRGMDIKTFVCCNDLVLTLTYNGMVYMYDNTRGMAIFLKNYFNNIFILDIACAGSHFLALTNKGKVYECTKDDTCQQVKYEFNEIITYISCGKGFSITVTDKGEVYGWGENTCGQLGTNGDVKTPLKITKLDGIVIEKVVCGYSHILALSTMGVLYVWGGNSCGQLGLNTTTNVSFPVQLKTKEMGKVWDIAACPASHISTAIVENNQVFIWGLCIGQNILVPTRTLLKCLHDAFAYYAWPKVTHQSLIFYDGKNSSLETSIEKAFNDPVTSDFIIKVQEKPIYVHKIILKIRCQYYRTMFQKFWAEGSQSVIQHNQFSYDVYKSFLKYLYTEKIDLSSDSEIVELLTLANMYFMSQLRNHCLEILIKKLTIENVVYLYNMSITHNIEELEKHCFKFALNNMTAVVQTPDFIQLDKNIITDFLIKAAKVGAFETVYDD